MNTIVLTQIAIKEIITHHVGNKTREEQLILSEQQTFVDDVTKELLVTYFTNPLKLEELHAFEHSVNLDLNEVYTIVSEIFADLNNFVSASRDLASLLYEYSLHPNINAGDLNIVLFNEILIEDEYVDAIGIFKSENDVPFLKINQMNSTFNINHERGFEIKGLDKGCLILNTDSDLGYKVLIVDKINGTDEAKYWKNDFLKVQPLNNEFHQTSRMMGLTKQYISQQVTDEFQLEKTDKIDLLNRSVNYFKTNHHFDKNEFEQQVLQEEEMIHSFQNFNEVYQEENGIELDDRFDLSKLAVKKQAKIFKSVLKLDKNFHIYIHGDRDMIEKGVDEKGRKYYKVYYDKES